MTTDRVALALWLLLVGCRTKAQTYEPANDAAAKPVPSATIAAHDASVEQAGPFVIADEGHLRWPQIVGDDVYAHAKTTARFAIAPRGAREELPKPDFKGWDLDHPVVDGDRVYYFAWNWVAGTRANILVQGASGTKPVLELDMLGVEFLVDADSVYATAEESKKLGTKLLRVAKSGGPVTTLVRARGALGRLQQTATHLYWSESDGAIEHVRRLAKKGGAVEPVFDAPEGTLFVFGTDIFHRPEGGPVHQLTGGALTKVPGTEGAAYLAHDGEDLFVATPTEIRTTSSTIAKLDGKPTGLSVTKRWIVWSTDKALYGLKR